MIVTRLKCPYVSFELCWLIRIGKIKSTQKVRSVAKNVTFAVAYGNPMRGGAR